MIQHRERPRVTRTASVIVALLVLAACGGGDAPSGLPAPVTVVSAVTLSTSSLALVRGDDTMVTAVVTLAPASPGSPPAIAWQSADTSVARVRDGRIYAWGEGSTEVTATAGSKSVRLPVTVELPPVGDFQITWRFAADVPEAVRASATRAADRLSRIVVGDVPSVTLTLPSFCGGQGEETIDDLVVYVRTGTASAGAVAGGGPCKLVEGRVGPAGGQIVVPLSTATFPDDLLDDIVLHELGHVLGIGTMPRWVAAIDTVAPNDARFTGSHAVAAYIALGFPTGGVPVTFEGHHAHWRDGTFRGDVMLPAGGRALSRLTAAALADLGYGVNLTAAEPWDPLGR